MLPSKADFFEQATRRLCGTLDLKTGVERLFAYASEVLPLKSISLGSAISENGKEGEELFCVTVDATCSTSGKRPPITETQARFVKAHNLMAPEKFHGEFITSPDHPLITAFLKLEPSAGHLFSLPWYVLRLTDEQHFVGGCCFGGTQEKPFSVAERELLRSLEPVLCIALHNYIQYQRIVSAQKSVLQENRRLRTALTGRVVDTEIIGSQGGLRRVMERVHLVAPRDVSILINGETGTGKELVARLLHARSPRAKQAFIALNCGAIPSSLIDSELFGHVKGAFTGATQEHKGYFERAHKGTLFLDEVSELPPDAQVRLLRALQEREVLPVGGRKPISVDTRLIAATNRDLRTMIRAGTFREDLYYRLRVVHILIPPLRERAEDIPALVRYMLANLAEQQGEQSIIPTLAQGELERMMRYVWPGNVRELQNVLMEAVFSTPSGLPLHVALDDSPLRSSPDIPYTSAIARENPTAHALPGSRMSAAENDARHFRAVLQSCGGRIKGPGGAAELLGLHPSTLRFRLKKLGIPFGRKAN